MSKIVKLSVPGGKRVYYVNASQVIYWQPLPFEPMTQIMLSNDKILSVEQPMEEILPHVSKVIKVSMRRHDVELVYYVTPSQVTWLQPHPVEKTGALIYLNDGKGLQVEQSIEEILPQLCKVIKVSARREKLAYYVNALRVVWWEPHPVETGTLIWLNNNKFFTSTNRWKRFCRKSLEFIAGRSQGSKARRALLDSHIATSLKSALGHFQNSALAMAMSDLTS